MNRNRHMRILATLLLALLALPAQGQAPDSVSARVDQMWHPFTSQYDLPGRIIVVDAYRSQDGAVTAYRAWVQGNHVHTVFKMGGRCFTAVPGDDHAAASSCIAFDQYYRQTKSLWEKVLARQGARI